LQAGFYSADVQVFSRARAKAIWWRGCAARRTQADPVACPLDVVEARSEDWSVVLPRLKAPRQPRRPQ